MSNCSSGVAAASIPMRLTSLPSTNDYRNLSSERSARPLHDAYQVIGPNIEYVPQKFAQSVHESWQVFSKIFYEVAVLAHRIRGLRRVNIGLLRLIKQPAKFLEQKIKIDFLDLSKADALFSLVSILHRANSQRCGTHSPVHSIRIDFAIRTKADCLHTLHEAFNKMSSEVHLALL